MPRKIRQVRYGSRTLGFQPRTAQKTCDVAGKVRYRTKLDAELALAQIRVSDSTRRSAASGRTEKRAYPCPHCKNWHLTHKEYTNTNTKETNNG